MKRFVLIGSCFGFMLTGYIFSQQTSTVEKDEGAVEKRWSEKKAWQWYQDVGVIRGCNYLPRTAANTTEIWQEDTFDAEIIDQELGWAQKAGYNSVRVFIQYLVWKNDPEGLKGRLEEFLRIADKHDIKTMWVLFDDCAFGYPPITEPYLGKQGDPKPGEYAPYWTPSPGHKTSQDHKAWPDLEKYVKDIVGTFAHDKRVLLWDLYNEPGMSGVGDKSMPLVEASVKWARKCNPMQPITIGAYQSSFEDAQSKRFMEISDVITFHSYDNSEGVRAKIEECSKTNRPVICTEFMVRRGSNTFFACLPLFAELQVGWYNWGLVAGRTQTYLHWGTKEGDPIPKRWQCDVFYTSGLAYDEREIELIRNFQFYEEIRIILPTSKKEAQSWNYTMNVPNFGWHRSGDYNYKASYQGTYWKQGLGAFGTKKENGQIVGTEWSSNNIWLRITFDLKGKKLVNPHLRIRHDEEVEVYISGELATKQSGYNTFYEYIPFSRRARAAVQEGENVIAVHCHKSSDSRGGQFIDVGVVDIIPTGGVQAVLPPEPEPEYVIDPGTPWPVEKAWSWYRSIPPTRGCNFLPSTAVNSTEMWQKESFDPETIDKELGWAHEAGYNSIRVFLQYIVWEDDPEGFLNRFDEFLGIADKHEITVMPIFFDDCCFAMKLEPLLGKQDDPLPGAINSGWVPSPGYSMVLDQAQWPKLEKYVKAFVSRFKNDKRVLVWDIYNEPGPFFDRKTSHALVKAGLGWVRQLKPIQPATAGSFASPLSWEFHQYCDIISHHDYGSAGLKKFGTHIYEKYKRPIFITECMFHAGGGSFENILPIYAEYNMGWYNWGLVAGRSQCYYYFGSPIGAIIPKVWLCEIFWEDGSPYDQKEIELIRNFKFQELSEEMKAVLPQVAQ